MPIFEIQDSDGTIYEVEAADPMTAAKAFRDRGQSAAPASSPQPEAPGNSLLGSAKAIGSGVYRGVTGLAGAPGDLRDAARGGVDWLLSQVGLDPSKAPQVPSPGMFGALDLLPGSQKIRGAIENQTGPLDYKPQTTTEKYLKTAGEFLPAAAAGPGGIGRRLVTQAIVPALASEAAGQATEGTAFEPLARIAGGIAGGVGAAGAANALTRARAPGVKAPDANALKDAARANYEAARQSGLEINPQPVRDLAVKLETELNKFGFSNRNVPETFGVLKDLQAAPAGGVMTATNFESARQALTQAARNISNPREASAAGRIISKLDDYLANIPAKDVLKGDAKTAAQQFAQARGNYAAAKRMETVDAKLYNADLNAAAANSGQNIDNATRQRIKAILISPKLRQGFNADEIAQMEQIVKGTFIGNRLRRVGNLLGGGGGLGQMLTGGAGALTGASAGNLPGAIIGGIAAPMAGMAARSGASAITMRQADELTRMLASRSPMHWQNMLTGSMPAPQQSLLNSGLLGALMARPSP